MYNKATNALEIAISGNQKISILPEMLNRHGLITGATGTGKTITLQSMAETFSDAGIPVFAADIKGDLSGLVFAGGSNPKIEDRIKEFNLADSGFNYHSYQACFWDVFGTNGHPVRTTVSDMGPLMLARLLNLNDTQSAVLSIIFKIADDNGLLLLDMKDLQKMLEYVGNNRNQFITEYGNISAASVGAIQRGLIELQGHGAEKFFGEPMMNIFDLIQTNDGKGVINILAADKLINSPKVYTTFLLWLLAELFEQLPETGDLKKPKVVFFFDEAHLLFKEAPKALVEKIEQTVRLIRSKGVGIFFVTQSPADVPESVLGQLGNRVQHALRAFTPNDEKAVKTAARTFRTNPDLNTEKVITELGVGEALVSFLDEKGAPSIVQRAFILPPQGKPGTITEQERSNVIKQSIFYGRYEKYIDRESAFEILHERIKKQLDQQQAETDAKKAAKEAKSVKKEKNPFDDLLNQMGKSVSRQVSNEVGRSITRGIFGSLFGKR